MVALRMTRAVHMKQAVPFGRSGLAAANLLANA